jgi:YrhK-like protein
VIGHALTVRPTPETRAVWDRWIGIGFAIGSLCFFVGPFPGVIDLVGAKADAIIFFVGSIFFTLAALLEVREGTLRIGRRWAADASWWSAAIQFVGTLLFNLDTFDALDDNLSSGQEDTLVFAPDLIGSACFLISGAIAYWVVTGPRLLPVKRDREWTMAAVNFLGCVFFGISAIASYIVPSTGSILDLAAVNWGTSLGALCFFIGAVMLLPRRHGVPRPKEA